VCVGGGGCVTECCGAVGLSLCVRACCFHLVCRAQPAAATCGGRNECRASAHTIKALFDSFTATVSLSQGVFHFVIFKRPLCCIHSVARCVLSTACSCSPWSVLSQWPGRTRRSAHHWSPTRQLQPSSQHRWGCWPGAGWVDGAKMRGAP
jgi:hypothetical protein